MDYELPPEDMQALEMAAKQRRTDKMEAATLAKVNRALRHNTFLATGMHAGGASASSAVPDVAAPAPEKAISRRVVLRGIPGPSSASSSTTPPVI